MFAVAVAFVTCALIVPSVARAQSLADVAKQEEARRKAVKEPGKVYTNADLRPDIVTSQPTAGQPAADPRAAADGTKASDAKGGPRDKPSVAEPVKDQAYWSERIGGARSSRTRCRAG